MMQYSRGYEFRSSVSLSPLLSSSKRHSKPHSFKSLAIQTKPLLAAMDSQTVAKDLESAILAAAAPPQIAAALSSLSDFLTRGSNHAPDQLRPFFSLAFPSLLRRLFGFDSVSWLEIAAGGGGSSDKHLSAQLLAFLSPGGPLFSSISAVDNEALVRYIFPLERLPEWIRYVLQSSSVASDVFPSVSPLFSSRIKEDEAQNLNQMQLNVFEYYMFWFAYYPVSRGISEVSSSGSVRATRKSRLENWVSSIPVISAPGRKLGQKPNDESSLYLWLLYSYLKGFVPKTGSGSFVPYRSSMLNYSVTDDESAYLKAEFVVETLVQFWMVDNDFSPLPLQVVRSLGFSFPYRVLGTAPPTPGLGDVVKLLVNYLHSYPSVPEMGNARMMFDKLVQRPLYRFILRSFLYCPIGASIKNSVQVFYLWMTYIEPWNISREDFSEFESVKEQRNEGNHVQKGYTVAWRDYVLDNYLFYNLMVVHFLEFAHRFIHTDVESVLRMVSEVLEVLCSSTELLALLCQVDTVYNTRQAGSVSYTTNDLNKYIPTIHEQLQDWEDGIMENDISGSLHERSSMNLRFFSEKEDGAYSLLQLLLLRAEYEIQLVPGDINISNHLHHLNSVKAKVTKLFGNQQTINRSPVVNLSTSKISTVQKDAFTFTPRRPKVEKYKGDWMKRPISNSEFAWLALILIWVSDRVNNYLGLDGNIENNDVGFTYVDVNGGSDGDGFRQINGAKEFIWFCLMFVLSGIGVICNSVLGFMRKRGVKINLRVLASKKVCGVVLVFALRPVISRVLSGVAAVLGFS